MQNIGIGHRRFDGCVILHIWGGKAADMGNATKRHHIPHRHGPSGDPILRQIADPTGAILRLQVGQGIAIEQDFAAARTHQTGKGAQQACLARAIGADDHGHATAMKRERQIIHHKALPQMH